MPGNILEKFLRAVFFRLSPSSGAVCHPTGRLFQLHLKCDDIIFDTFLSALPLDTQHDRPAL
jgi:hypothetical protein